MSAWAQLLEWLGRSNWSPILLLAMIALVAIGIGGALRLKSLRSWQPYAASVVVLAVLAGTWLETQVEPWQALVAFLPTLIIFYHAFNLWRERPRCRPDTERTNDREQELMARVEKEVNAYYGADAIVARYVLPALLIPIVGLWQFTFIDATEEPSLFAPLELAREQLWPFEYGLFGAYVFVFLELGKRGVRNDITPVSILWCLTTLVLGPALAALLPTVFTPEVLAAQRDPASVTWGERAVWIFAGYAPRFMFRMLEGGVKRMLLQEEPAVREERRIPLERVSGIGSDEAERLAEEGIRDVHALACVDPIRLMRDTRFDNWRILSWVNQALLISRVHEDVWRELLKRGYQGASDVSRSLVGPPMGRTLTGEEVDRIFEEISKASNTSKVVLKDELTRLVEDPRAQSFFALAWYVLAKAPALPPVHAPPPPPAPAPQTGGTARPATA